MVLSKKQKEELCVSIHRFFFSCSSVARVRHCGLLFRIVNPKGGSVALLNLAERFDLNSPPSHKAILCYFQECGFQEAATAFQKEAAIEPDAGLNGLLEKKWTSVIRLQKKVGSLHFLASLWQISELESKMSQMEEGKHKKTGGDGLPRLPEKFTLSGHRNHVTSVKFHPQYSQARIYFFRANSNSSGS